jgi:hypothetical protein
MSTPGDDARDDNPDKKQMTDKPGKHPGDYTDSKQDDKFRWQSN